MIFRHHSHGRILIAALLLAGLAMSLIPGSVALAGDSGNLWSVVGDPGDAGFSPAQASNVTLALSSQGIPYVAYIDYRWGTGDPRVTVQRHYGTGWETVGEAGFSNTLHPGQVNQVRVALNSSNVPYVVYGISEGNSSVLNAAKFEGGTWQTVGNANFAYASDINLVIDQNGIPYIAFVNEDPVAQTFGASVMTLNAGTWQYLGAPAVPAEFSDGMALYTSIALDSTNTPYVVYSDYTRSGKATVKKYTGTAWETVGAAGFSDGSASYTSIDLDSSGTPYVAYQDGLSMPTKATVMKLGTSGWETVGSPRFTAGEASFLNIALNAADVPYLAYKDTSLNGKAAVYYYDSLPIYRIWRPIGTQAANPAMSEARANNISMALDKSGNPWVAYADGQFTPERATVKRYNMPDMMPPRLTLIATQTAVSAGWYKQPVTVNVYADNPTGSTYKILNLTCVDGDNIASPVVRVDSADGATALQGQFTLNEGRHSIECWATNDAGYIGRAVDSSEMPAAFNVDMTPPQLNPVVIPNPAKVGSQPSVSPQATDNLASSTELSATCGTPDTSQEGTGFTVNCTVTDPAGNSASKSATYDVIPADPTDPPSDGYKVFLPLVRR